MGIVIHEVTPTTTNRMVCHCSGCQTCARRTDPGVLDRWGGTERMQVDPADVVIEQGRDALTAQQQQRNGAFRWMASCCDTPFGLTLPHSRIPFIALDVARIVDFGAPLADVAGPIRARVNGRFSSSERKKMHADVGSLLGMLRHLMPLTWRWWRAKSHRRGPFFDPDGVPVVEVEKLYADAIQPVFARGCR